MNLIFISYFTHQYSTVSDNICKSGNRTIIFRNASFYANCSLIFQVISWKRPYDKWPFKMFIAWIMFHVRKNKKNVKMVCVIWHMVIWYNELLRHKKIRISIMPNIQYTKWPVCQTTLCQMTMPNSNKPNGSKVTLVKSNSKRDWYAIIEPLEWVQSISKMLLAKTIFRLIQLCCREIYTFNLFHYPSFLRWQYQSFQELHLQILNNVRGQPKYSILD